MDVEAPASVTNSDDPSALAGNFPPILQNLVTIFQAKYCVAWIYYELIIDYLNFLVHLASNHDLATFTPQVSELYNALYSIIDA